MLGLLAAAAVLAGAVTTAVAAPQAPAVSVMADGTSGPNDMHW